MAESGSRQAARGSRDSAARESFYSLTHEGQGGRACRGTACFVARRRCPTTWEKACAQAEPLFCLGKCYAAPAQEEQRGRPIIKVHARKAVLLERLAAGCVPMLDDYVNTGGYKALDKARRASPESLLRAVEDSGLRGRGGAGFPTGLKWRAVSRQSATEKFVVVNADEGDPGVYIDRFFIEDDPHRLIEATAIAGHAVGARKGWIFLRGEYERARHVLDRALAEAAEAGFVGRGGNFEIGVVIGRGSYVCGEETSLLNAIEGVRPEVRPRPPYPTERGLFGRPTLVNNVETLAAVPWIVEQGADAYRELGFSHSRGTKVVALNSLFRRPGLYEVEFGVTLRQIVEDLGGGLESDRLKGVIVGGPLAGIVPPELLDTRFGFEELRAIGAMVGHGGVVAFDGSTPMRELVRHVAEFAALESCGKCTPCRRGTQALAEMYAGARHDTAEAERIAAALMATSLCGLGTGLGEFMVSALRFYAQELT